MKALLLFGFLTTLIASSLFAGEVDPRIFEIMRKEQSQAQTFCYSFIHQDGYGIRTAEACLHLSADRYFGNAHLAAKDALDEPGVGAAITRTHSEFCAAVARFPGSGTTLAADCETWNRARSELFKLGTIEGTPPSTLSAKIERAERYRQRFCQTLLNAGNTGDPSDFALRISSCFAMAKLATATDRAILLGAF